MHKSGDKIFDCELAILGAGFSGLGAAMALQKAGFHDLLIFEKAARVGGTWRENIYPGAACDVKSIMYSYSYAMNPNWSRVFSPGSEIQTYIEDTAFNAGLMDRIRFNHAATALTWEDGGWTLMFAGGKQVRSRFIISALGPLHVPVKPAFPGADTYQGTIMHSAEWQPDYDVSGKKIAIIGSAASAVQIAPAVAQKAARVTILQRTANWIVPREDAAYRNWQKKLFRLLPFTQRLLRWKIYLMSELRFTAFRGEDRLFHRFMRHLVVKFMRSQIDDPELREKIMPDYALGCKRILLSDDYLACLNRNNVTLETSGIDHINGSGIVTASGEQIDADLIVLATGFNPTKMLGDMVVTGKGGVKLGDQWAAKIQAYRTIHIANMPNFFMMVGPNSGLGHLSIIFMIEQQARYITRLMRHMRNHHLSNVSVAPAVENAYNAQLQTDLKFTIWHSGCKSWYQDENGHIFSLWPHRTTRYWWHLRTASMDQLDFSN